MEFKAEQDQSLRGMRILVVDDEFLIMIDIEGTLGDAGADVVTASTLSAALKIAENEILTAAVLDFRLGQHTTEAVAGALAARSVPFVFYSGQDLPAHVRELYSDVRIMSKPLRQDALVGAVAELVRG